MLLLSCTDSVGSVDGGEVVPCLIVRGEEGAVLPLVLKGVLLDLPVLPLAEDGEACLPAALAGCLLLPGVRAQACTAGTG